MAIVNILSYCIIQIFTEGCDVHVTSISSILLSSSHLSQCTASATWLAHHSSRQLQSVRKVRAKMKLMYFALYSSCVIQSFYSVRILLTSSLLAIYTHTYQCKSLPHFRPCVHLSISSTTTDGSRSSLRQPSRLITCCSSSAQHKMMYRPCARVAPVSTTEVDRCR